LKTLHSLPALESLVSTEMDQKIDQKYQADTYLITMMGARLTKLHLHKIHKVSFSLLKSIKQHCSKLEKLAILMTGPLGVSGAIEFEKDDHLQMNSGNLKNLIEVHLTGPFPSSVTRYLLDTSQDLQVLTLSIDWPEAALCNLVPEIRLDYLGTSYLQQVMQGNSLAKVRELHLLTQYSRGQKFLVKEFAEFVMKKLPSLRHLGSFSGWNMSDMRKRQARRFPVTKNLDISIDPETIPRPSEFAGKFSKIYVGDQLNSSCQWEPPVQPASSIMGIFAQMVLDQPQPQPDPQVDQPQPQVDQPQPQ